MARTKHADPEPYTLIREGGELAVYDADPAEGGKRIDTVTALTLKHEGGSHPWKGCLHLKSHDEAKEIRPGVQAIRFDPRLIYTEPWFRNVGKARAWAHEAGVEFFTEDEALERGAS